MPSLNIIKARQYPNTRIILAYSGMGSMLLTEAYITAKECENIYLETSWTSAEDIEWLVKNIGGDRILFGSDFYSDSCYRQIIEIEKYKIINISDEYKVNCLFKKSKEVFNLNIGV